MASKYVRLKYKDLDEYVPTKEVIDNLSSGGSGTVDSAISNPDTAGYIKNSMIGKYSAGNINSEITFNVDTSSPVLTIPESNGVFGILYKFTTTATNVDEIFNVISTPWDLYSLLDNYIYYKTSASSTTSSATQKFDYSSGNMNYNLYSTFIAGAFLKNNNIISCIKRIVGEGEGDVVKFVRLYYFKNDIDISSLVGTSMTLEKGFYTLCVGADPDTLYQSVIVKSFTILENLNYFDYSQVPADWIDYAVNKYYRCLTINSSLTSTEQTTYLNILGAMPATPEKIIIISKNKTTEASIFIQPYTSNLDVNEQVNLLTSSASDGNVKSIINITNTGTVNIPNYTYNLNVDNIVSSKMKVDDIDTPVLHSKYLRVDNLNEEDEPTTSSSRLTITFVDNRTNLIAHLNTNSATTSSSLAKLMFNSQEITPMTVTAVTYDI